MLHIDVHKNHKMTSKNGKWEKHQMVDTNVVGGSGYIDKDGSVVYTQLSTHYGPSITLSEGIKDTIAINKMYKLDREIREKI